MTKQSDHIHIGSVSSTRADLQNQALTHWDLINILATKRFAQESLAEEAALFVIDSLKEKNWAPLAQFQGRSKFSTFFSSIIFRLLEDFSRKRFGRVYTPKWIMNLGGMWITLFRLLCLERFPFQDAVEQAKARPPQTPENELENIAEEIVGRVDNCGKNISEVSVNDEELATNSDSWEDQERELVFKDIATHLWEESDSLTLQNNPLVHHKINLQAQERLLLKLCFQDNIPVSEAGKILGLNRFQIHGRLRRLLKKIQTNYEDAGYAEEIRTLLQ